MAVQQVEKEKKGEKIDLHAIRLGLFLVGSVGAAREGRRLCNIMAGALILKKYIRYYIYFNRCLHCAQKRAILVITGHWRPLYAVARWMPLNFSNPDLA